MRGKGHYQGCHLTQLLEQEGHLGSVGNKAAMVPTWGRVGISRRKGCGEMSFAKSQPLTPQPKSRLPERTMAPYSLKHLWTQQDLKKKKKSLLLEVPPPGRGQQGLGVTSSLGASVGKTREGQIPA